MSAQRQYMPCEWCEMPASYRIVSRAVPGGYKRFACREHVVKVDCLVALDLGDVVYRESVVNPTGFAAGTGRMLGPEREPARKGARR